MLGPKEYIIKNLLKSLIPEILGAIFSVLLLGLGYFTISFVSMVIESNSFKNLASNISQNDILPITAVVAILLFLLREIFDLLKKRSDKKNSLEAVKTLIADEIEKNHWALVSLFRIASDLADDFNNNENAVHYLHIARNGSEHFRSKENPTDEQESGQSIPKFHTSMYEKLIPEIAKLDQELFSSVHSTYEQIIELIHYRDTIIDYLAGKDLAPIPDMTKAFIINFSEEKNDYYEYLNKTYKLIKNKKLETWKLR